MTATGSTALTPQGQGHCDRCHSPALLFGKAVEITALSLICISLDKQGWSKGHQTKQRTFPTSLSSR